MIKNQKNIPSAMPDASSGLGEGLFGLGLGEDIAIINNDTITMKSKGKKEIPHITGPKGVIQSWPAQPIRKIIKNRMKNPRMRLGRGDNKANNKEHKTETIKAAGMM